MVNHEKNNSIYAVLCVAAFALAASTTFSEQANEPYDGSWASLQEMPLPAWFDDGKIGIFIHWGPYSVVG